MFPLQTKIENALEPVFRDLPALPKGGKEWLVKAWPIIAVVFGVLQIMAAVSLWRLGHTVDSLVNYTNEMARMYGNPGYVRHLGLFYWLSLAVLIVDGIILLMAYSGLKARKKRGWDLLFLSALVNAVYGLVSAFDGYYGGFGKLFSAVLGTGVAFYFLFQVRSYYLGANTATSAAHTSHTARKKK